MKVDKGGVLVRLSSDPFIKQTRNGNVMISGFEISNRRKKTSSGEWVNDPYYELLRVGITIFGESAEKISSEGGLAKGAELLITSGNIAKPKREGVDIEIIVFEAEVVKPATEKSSKEKPATRTSRGVKSTSDTVTEAFENLGANEEDLPF